MPAPWRRSGRARNVVWRDDLVPRRLTVSNLHPPRDLAVAGGQLAYDPSLVVESEYPKARRLACYRSVAVLETAAGVRKGARHLRTEEEAVAAVADSSNPDRWMDRGPRDPSVLAGPPASDKAAYGEFNDYGPYAGTEWGGYKGLPKGNWVYVAPHWYIWAQPAK